METPITPIDTHSESSIDQLSALEPIPGLDDIHSAIIQTTLLQNPEGVLIRINMLHALDSETTLITSDNILDLVNSATGDKHTMLMRRLRDMAQGLINT